MLDRVAALRKAEQLLADVRSHPRREKGWAFRHGSRTANLSLWLRERLFPGEDRMDDVLYAAALFHDCAKDEGVDHAEAGAARAKATLSRLLGKQELGLALRAIAQHDKRLGEHSDLERILQDADVLDHFGAIEVWLNVSYSVFGGEGPECALDFYACEWASTVECLRSALNFDLSRQVFDERVAFSDAWRRRLEVESTGGVFAS